MPSHPAFRIHTTSSGKAGILAFFRYACKMVWTFRISSAFRLFSWKKMNSMQNTKFSYSIGYKSSQISILLFLPFFYHDIYSALITLPIWAYIAHSHEIPSNNKFTFHACNFSPAILKFLSSFSWNFCSVLADLNKARQMVTPIYFCVHQTCNCQMSDFLKFSLSS